MSDLTPETTPTHPTPRRKYKRRKKPARRIGAAPPRREAMNEDFSDLAGMTTSACPERCTAKRCIISTVAVCKHPTKTGDAGCGTVTMRNRERATHFLKLQLLQQT